MRHYDSASICCFDFCSQDWPYPMASSKRVLQLKRFMGALGHYLRWAWLLTDQSCTKSPHLHTFAIKRTKLSTCWPTVTFTSFNLAFNPIRSSLSHRGSNFHGLKSMYSWRSQDKKTLQMSAGAMSNPVSDEFICGYWTNNFRITRLKSVLCVQNASCKLFSSFSTTLAKWYVLLVTSTQHNVYLCKIAVSFCSWKSATGKKSPLKRDERMEDVPMLRPCRARLFPFPRTESLLYKAFPCKREDCGSIETHWNSIVAFWKKIWWVMTSSKTISSTVDPKNVSSHTLLHIIISVPFRAYWRFSLLNHDTEVYSDALVPTSLSICLGNHPHASWCAGSNKNILAKQTWLILDINQYNLEKSWICKPFAVCFCFDLLRIACILSILIFKHSVSMWVWEVGNKQIHFRSCKGL